MVGEFSDGEDNSPMVRDSVGHEADLVDAMVDTEVDLCLPLGEQMLQDRPRVLAQAAIGLDEQRRLAPPKGAKPKRSGHGLLPHAMDARDGWRIL